MVQREQSYILSQAAKTLMELGIGKILYFCIKLNLIDMAVYQIRINEKVPLGKSLVAYLQSIPQIVTFEIPKGKSMPKSELYHSLDRAFADVRQTEDGAKSRANMAYI